MTFEKNKENMKEFAFLAARRPGFPPRMLVVQGALFGVGMIGVAWLIVVVSHAQGAATWFPRQTWQIDLLIGALAGAAFALGVWRLLDYVPPLRQIERLLARLLDMDALRPRHALLLGLVAGIPEEILFRGAIQPLIGLAGASLLFGALHALTPAYFVYASAAGFLLGGLAIWRGGLWAAIAAHVVIDALMLLLMMRGWRRSHPARLSDGHDRS